VAWANFRRSLARVHGPAAITWWSWLITLPFALTVMSGQQYVTGGPAAVLAVAGLQHAILGGMLLAGVAVLRVVPARGRALAVLAIYAVIGAARPLLFLEAGGLLGIPVEAGDLAGRIAINVVSLVVVLSLIAIGVDLVREHRGVFRRLRAAQRASEHDAARAAERLQTLRSTAVDGVVAALEEAADAAATNRMQAPEAARLLRAVAEDVVRPASHRVFDDGDPEPAPEPDVLRRREWSAAVIGGMRAAPPLLTAALFSLLVVPYGITLFGMQSLLPVAGGLLVLVTANTAIARLPLPRGAAPRLIVLVVLYVATGVVLSIVDTGVLLLIGAVPDSVWFQAVMYPIIALGIAFVASLTTRLRLDQAELETAVQASVAAAARIRADYEHERGSLARLLHAGVQSELIAGALALTAVPDADPAQTAERIAEVVDRARAALRGSSPEPEPAGQVRALIDSWSSAIRLHVRVAEGAWDRLGDPARAEAVADTISEGLANAVRHGNGAPVRLELRAGDPRGVRVVIVSGGTLGAREYGAGRPGIGLRQLSERGTVALRERAGRVELAVAIP
jgi:signal transduction histidine kinase